MNGQNILFLSEFNSLQRQAFIQQVLAQVCHSIGTGNRRANVIRFLCCKVQAAPMPLDEAITHIGYTDQVSRTSILLPIYYQAKDNGTTFSCFSRTTKATKNCFKVFLEAIADAAFGQRVGLPHLSPCQMAQTFVNDFFKAYNSIVSDLDLYDFNNDTGRKHLLKPLRYFVGTTDRYRPRSRFNKDTRSQRMAAVNDRLPIGMYLTLKTKGNITTVCMVIDDCQSLKVNTYDHIDSAHASAIGITPPHTPADYPTSLVTMAEDVTFDTSFITPMEQAQTACLSSLPTVIPAIQMMEESAIIKSATIDAIEALCMSEIQDGYQGLLSPRLFSPSYEQSTSFELVLDIGHPLDLAA
eukprot:m.142523 g.142523  ORF g.142523 m.142523 type:complete len:354 (+) comp16161_c0_seq3:118-1179(+)